MVVGTGSPFTSLAANILTTLYYCEHPTLQTSKPVEEHAISLVGLASLYAVAIRAELVLKRCATFDVIGGYALMPSDPTDDLTSIQKHPITCPVCSGHGVALFRIKLRLPLVNSLSHLAASFCSTLSLQSAGDNLICSLYHCVTRWLL